MGESPQVRLLVTLARRLPCHYPARGDRCDDHIKTPGFTRCQACHVRDIAETIKLPEPVR